MILGGRGGVRNKTTASTKAAAETLIHVGQEGALDSLFILGKLMGGRICLIVLWRCLCVSRETPAGRDERAFDSRNITSRHF